MSGESYELLKRFFETSPAAAQATRPLGKAAQVGLELEGGPAHFSMANGSAQVLPGAAPDPDFTLLLPPAAVKKITAVEGGVGEFGIEFFKLVLEKDPTLRARVHIDAPTSRLMTHGYLGVLAVGGLKVTWWLLKNGVKNPKAAIDRLRGVK